MKPIYSGKVREIYDISDERFVIVSTDRISAFDKILPLQIKNKGIVLNQLSNSGLYNNTLNFPHFTRFSKPFISENQPFSLISSLIRLKQGKLF